MKAQHTIGSTFFDTEAECWASTIMLDGVAVSYVYADTKDEAKKRADFIILACNNHDGMLESLSELLADAYNAIDHNNPTQIREATLKKVRDALAKARGV